MMERSPRQDMGILAVLGKASGAGASLLTERRMFENLGTLKYLKW